MKEFTKGFHLSRFDIYRHGLVASLPEIDICPVDPSVLQILSQPFTYLHRGAQCYVFQSQDERYVIKIFQKHPRCEKQRKPLDFSSCLIAYQSAREETALLYMHLTPTEHLLPKLSLRSPLGQWYSLPLDRYAFVIQKKAQPFRETLMQASKEGRLAVYLTSFLALLDQRLAKGIRNNDVSLSSNFGFLGEKAVEFDFGRYIQSPDFLQPYFQKLEKRRFIAQLRAFMKADLPNDVDILEQVLTP